MSRRGPLEAVVQLGSAVESALRQVKLRRRLHAHSEALNPDQSSTFATTLDLPHLVVWPLFDLGAAELIIQYLKVVAYLHRP